MARPRKNPEDPKWSAGATERVIAPDTVATVAPPPQAYVQQPRQLRVERAGAQSEPMVHHFPQVRGGVCEWCGILDPNVSSQYQYKLCPHYRGMNLRCSYCPPEKDPDEVVRSTKLEVVEHPDKPGVMIVVCSSYECEKKHQERFRQSV
jgi:hypothetical protein